MGSPNLITSCVFKWLQALQRAGPLSLPTFHIPRCSISGSRQHHLKWWKVSTLTLATALTFSLFIDSALAKTPSWELRCVEPWLYVTRSHKAKWFLFLSFVSISSFLLFSWGQLVLGPLRQIVQFLGYPGSLTFPSGRFSSQWQGWPGPGYLERTHVSSSTRYLPLPSAGRALSNVQNCGPPVGTFWRPLPSPSGTFVIV